VGDGRGVALGALVGVGTGADWQAASAANRLRQIIHLELTATSLGRGVGGRSA